MSETGDPAFHADIVYNSMVSVTIRVFSNAAIVDWLVARVASFTHADYGVLGVDDFPRLHPRETEGVADGPLCPAMGHRSSCLQPMD